VPAWVLLGFSTAGQRTHRRLRVRLTTVSAQTIRTAAVVALAAGFCVYGLWKGEPSFVAMGVGLLGAPSISVVIGKNGDAINGRDAKN